MRTIFLVFFFILCSTKFWPPFFCISTQAPGRANVYVPHRDPEQRQLILCTFLNVKKRSDLLIKRLLYMKGSRGLVIFPWKKGRKEEIGKNVKEKTGLKLVLDNKGEYAFWLILLMIIIFFLLIIIFFLADGHLKTKEVSGGWKCSTGLTTLTAPSPSQTILGYQDFLT